MADLATLDFHRTGRATRSIQALCAMTAMRKIHLLLILTTLALISCDNRRNDYGELVSEADSIVFSYNIEGRYREAQFLTDSSNLQFIKKLLTRNIEISDLNHFVGGSRIQLFNDGKNSGTIEISETVAKVNFSSAELEFGYGLTYGLGQFIGESRNEFLKELEYINHQTLVLPNRLSDKNKPTFKDLAVDTTELFGVWTIDPEGPHADFWLTKDSYYIVDYDGNGHVNYELNGRTLKIFFEEGEQVMEIISTSNDTLRTYSNEYEIEYLFTRWKN